MAPKAVMTSACPRGWVVAMVTGAGVSGTLLTAARILTRGEVEEVALGTAGEQHQPALGAVALLAAVVGGRLRAAAALLLGRRLFG